VKLTVSDAVVDVERHLSFYTSTMYVKVDGLEGGPFHFNYVCLGGPDHDEEYDRIEQEIKRRKGEEA
jgi:hypothetical protein